MNYFKLIMVCLIALGLAACNQRDKNISDAAGTGGETAWQTDFNAALAQAKEQGKPVLADFFATWCGPCKQMDRATFPDPKVVAELTNWIAVKIDVDQQKELAQKFNVQAIPTMILFDSSGQVVSTKMGYIAASELVSFAEQGRKSMAK